MQIGDYLYKVTFNKLNFHVEKVKIIEVKQHKYILRFWSEIHHEPNLLLPNFDVYNEYTCDNGETYTQNSIDSFYTYFYRDFWICSNSDIAKKYIIDWIDRGIKVAKNEIIRCEKTIKKLEKKKKIYE